MKKIPTSLKVTVRVYVKVIVRIYTKKLRAGERISNQSPKNTDKHVASCTFMVKYPTRVTRMARPGSNDNHFFEFF